MKYFNLDNSFALVQTKQGIKMEVRTLITRGLLWFLMTLLWFHSFHQSNAISTWNAAQAQQTSLYVNGYSIWMSEL